MDVLFVCLIGFALLFFLRSEYEKNTLSVEEVTIHSAKIRKSETFVFLSDLHNWAAGSDQGPLLQAIDKVEPDFVLIGGDSLVSRRDGRIDYEYAVRLICRLAEKYPVYCANGNHEARLFWKPELYGDFYQYYVSCLEQAGVVYLSNSGTRVGNQLYLTGVNLVPAAYEKLYGRKVKHISDQELFSGIEKSNSEYFQILMAHSPMYFEQYAKWGADLTLSGHFHGGTILLPVKGGVGLMTPQFQFFSPWCSGLKQKSRQYLLISRGLGTHSIKIRFLNKPQLLVVHLEK